MTRLAPTLASALLISSLFVSGDLKAQSQGAYLGHLTWPDAAQRLRDAPLVVVPFGAGAKEHGPHLPMNADQVVLQYLLEQAVDSLPVVVAPPILHGWFPAFRAFPGTEVSDPNIFTRYVLEVAQSLVAHGAQRVVFLNTGIRNATGLPIAIAARELRVQTGTPTLVVSWDDLETDELAALEEQRTGGHADEIETSIHLVLQPQLVHMERAVASYPEAGKAVTPGYRPGLYAQDPKDPAYSTTGHTGDPRLATREKGERALAIMTAQWLGALQEFSQVPRHRKE